MSLTGQDVMHEAETEAYKIFLVIAKKLKKIDYVSKWEIVPDVKDPCRKFTINRDIGWTTIKLQLYMKQSYHRGQYDDSRYFYKPQIQVGGLFSYQLVDQPVNMFLQLKPRVAKKIIETINTIIIPKFYKDITDEIVNREQKTIAQKEFQANINKIKGLQVIKQQWGDPIGKVPNCPFTLKCEQNTVEFTAEMSYDDFAQMNERMGWNK